MSKKTKPDERTYKGNPEESSKEKEIFCCRKKTAKNETQYQCKCRCLSK